MRVLKTHSIILAFFFVFISCKENYFPLEHENIPLKSNLIFENLFLGQPFSLINHKDYLIFSDYYDNYLFSAINIRTGEMHRFGALGKGLGEFGMGTIIENYYDSIQILNRNDFKNYIVMLDSFINNPNYRPQGYEIFDIKDIEASAISSYIKINKKDYIGHGIFNRNSLAFINDGEITNTILPIPSNDKEKNPTFLQMAYQGYLKTNYDGTRIVFATLNSDNINFYKVVDNKLEVIREYRDNFPDYEPVESSGFFYVVMKDKCINGFSDINCSKNSVYAYFDESKRGDPDRIKNSNSNKYLIKFDWDGNIKIKYELDRKIDFFCVSNDEKKIFALSESKFYEFNL